jgi:cobalt-zinc-cadmium efflux system membrane fusion protein
MFKKATILPMIFWFMLSACSPKPEAKQNEEIAASLLHLDAAQEKTIGISTIRLQRRLMEHKLKVSGFIDVPPQNLISISVPLPGFLKYTELLPGMEISKGQVLAVLEDAGYLELQQEYLETKIRQSQLSAEASRLKTLEENQAASSRESFKAKTDAESNAVKLKALEEKLKLLGISPDKLKADNMSTEIQLRSPVHGFVSEVKVNKGKYIQAGESLFELVDPSDIHLNLKVLEGDLSFIKEGLKVEAWTNHSPEEKHPASVILVSRTLGPDKTSEVHCHFEQHEKELAPGMFMNAILYAGSDSLNVLPSECILRDGDKYFVIVSEGKGNYQFVSVEPVIKEREFTSISAAGKLEGKSVVQKGAWGLWMSFKNRSEGEQGHAH